MCRTAEEIIQYISQAKKQTIVKVYINGENLPDDPSLQVFGTKTSRILVGDLEHIKKYLKANQNQITDTYLQQDHRNSAIPMLDLTHINARIEPGAMIRDNVTIGDHAVIMMGAILGGRAQVGKNCHIGAGAVLAGVIEPPSASPVIIEDDVLIGANAVVVEGVHIGKGAVVGAGSIVLNDVPANAVVAGNPARIIKHEKNDATKEKTQLMEDLRNL